MSITWNRKPLTFAVPQVGRTALLPQQAAVGTMARIKRVNEDYFNIQAGHVDNGGISGSHVAIVSACTLGGGVEGWQVERKENHGYIRLATFSKQHLRSALGMAVLDATVEYVIDRDWEEGR